MSNEMWLLLIGAGIGLVSSIIGAVVQHLLSLRAERKKREWDRQEELRRTLAPSARVELSGRDMEVEQFDYSLQTSAIRKGRSGDIEAIPEPGEITQSTVSEEAQDEP